MKELKLGIKKENHRFDIRIMPFRKSISYTSFCNDYELVIVFGNKNNRHPYVNYKNLRYSGAISSRANWNIFISNPRTCLVSMKNCCIWVKSDMQTNDTHNENIKTFDKNHLVISPNECQNLYNECILYNKHLYDLIFDKEVFKKEILELIEDDFMYLDEYENKEAYFEEISEYFENFILAEKECPKITELISVEDILKQEYTSLKELKIQDTTEFIDFAIDVIAEEYKDKISIYYSRETIYNDIVNEAILNIEERNYAQFKKKYSNLEKIEKLLHDKILVLNDPEPLLERINYLITSKEIISKEMLFDKSDELIEEYLSFERVYEQFEDCDYVKVIDLKGEKEQLFLAYEEGKATLSETELMEYRAYNVIMPYYHSALYNRSKTKLKPSIENLDSYFKFARNTIELLIKNNIVIKRGNTFKYNNNGDVVRYVEDIDRLLRS